MKKKKLFLFAGVCVLQLLTVLYMVRQWEAVLEHGERYYWVTAPVDPYDAFKGRYIDLNFKETTAPVTDSVSLAYGQRAYAAIGVNSEGKAVLTGISPRQPQGVPFLKVKVYYTENGRTHVELPFKRYYLPESLAAPAEAAYRKSAGQTGVAAVRIQNGYGVIEELYIGDQTLRDYLKR